MIYILMIYTLCLVKSMYVSAVQIASRNCNGIIFEQYFGSSPWKKPQDSYDPYQMEERTINTTFLVESFVSNLD
jgi:hypothetical protein